MSAGLKSPAILLLAPAPVDRLVTEVMRQEPYKSARRIFWIMDNCSAHRGQKAAKRLRDKWPNAILVHTPIHASWLKQMENGCDSIVSNCGSALLAVTDLPACASGEGQTTAIMKLQAISQSRAAGRRV